MTGSKDAHPEFFLYCIHKFTSFYQEKSILTNQNAFVTNYNKFFSEIIKYNAMCRYQKCTSVFLLPINTQFMKESASNLAISEVISNIGKCGNSSVG